MPSLVRQRHIYDKNTVNCYYLYIVICNDFKCSNTWINEVSSLLCNRHLLMHCIYCISIDYSTVYVYILVVIVLEYFEYMAHKKKSKDVEKSLKSKSLTRKNKSYYMKFKHKNTSYLSL